MKKHFVLVHGSCHGAWCWYKVVAVLKSLGHNVTAVDLAASGINTTKQANEVHCISEYAQPLMEFMEGLPEDERVILVGHSLGGISTTMAMERFPRKIAVAVFVSAFMPGPDLPYLHITQQTTPGIDFFMDSQYTYRNGLEQPPTTVIFGHDFLASNMYQNSPPEDLVLASMLLRPSPLFNDPESLKGSSLTKENYGSVRRVYTVCTADIGLPEKTQRSMIERNPPDDVQVIIDADHMPMFSKVSELCSCLLDIAESCR
ncbi:hypothetical protein ACH5RR_010122 [Cinchona calisaya]|uniref:AB hydrolase-1 domain-containing protein n=1 Tax=Cinchona calisaya TaxID=153742 RepID=A0ABD3AI74_9GENT